VKHMQYKHCKIKSSGDRLCYANVLVFRVSVTHSIGSEELLFPLAMH